MEGHAAGLGGAFTGAGRLAAYRPDRLADLRRTREPAGQVAPGTSLRRSSRQLIVQTLQECGGNVSSAAKRLGVSRGLIYRNLKSL